LDQEKTYKWIQDRMRDLHAGRLSAEDRVFMEELAKTDPFVKDAMEGYQENAHHDHSVLLKVISDRIQNKKASGRPKILPLSKGWLIPAVAASLVLILATWVVMFYIEKQGDAAFVAAEPVTSTAIEHSTEVQLSYADSMEDGIVYDETKAGSREEPPTTLSPGATGNIPQVPDKSKSALSRKENTREDDDRDSKTYSTTNQPEKPSGGLITEAEEEQPSDQTKNEPVYATPAPPVKELRKEAVSEDILSDKSLATGGERAKTMTKKDEGLYANQMSPDIMKQRVAGKVSGRKGETLFGANISVRNTNLLTSTDFNGKFELYLPEPQTTIDVSIPGYTDTTLTVVQGDEDISIILDIKDEYSPSDSPAGSVARQQAKDDKAKIYVAQGTDYILFSSFVKENSKYPVQDIFTYTCKEVTLEFSVSQNGRPELLKKIKSYEDAKYSAEAWRLLKKGPYWKCEDVYPCVREYTIYFK